MNDQHGITANDAWMKDSRIHRGVCVALVLFAIAIRLADIRQPMRGDEAWTYMEFALPSLSQTLSDYTVPNNHILHTLLVKLSTTLLGDAPWAIRIPAFVAGVLLVPATYVATRSLIDRTAAIFAAALVAALPGLVLYSTNARGYTMICLAFMVLIILANTLADADSKRRWIGFALVLALGAYTVPVMLYPAGTVCLWLLIERGRRHGRNGLRRLVPPMAAALALAATLTLLAYLPVLLRSGADSIVNNRYVTSHSWSRVVLDVRWILGVIRQVHGLGIPREFLVVFALLGALPLFVKSEHRISLVTLLIAYATWTTIMVVVTRRPPPARAWLFLAPFAAIYIGAGLAHVARWLAGSTPGRLNLLGAAGALMLALGIATKPLIQRDILNSPENGTLIDGEAIAQWLHSHDVGNDRVVCYAFSEPVIDYYLYRIAGKRLRDVAAPNRTGRVFVVTNGVRQETVETLKYVRRDVNWDSFTEPKLKQRFLRASVYEATPLTR